MDYSLLLGIHNVDIENDSEVIKYFESRFENDNPTNAEPNSNKSSFQSL